jgi:hypothetical protein
MLPPVQAPATAYFGQQQQQPYVPEPPTSEPPVAAASQPASPFEEVAAAAFDAQQQGGDTRSSQVPKPSAAEATRGDHFDPIGAVVRGAEYAIQGAGQVLVTPQQVGLAAARRVIPIVSSYTRLPLMKRRQQTEQGPITPELA